MSRKIKYKQLAVLAMFASIFITFEIKPAAAGPVCRHAWPQAGMSAYRGFIRPDLIVGYDFFANVAACEYGSGRLVTCELRASNIYVERWFSRNPPTGNDHYRTWTFPPMAKGGFAKGHDCNDLIHDNEDAKWVVSISNSLVPGIVDQDKLDVNAIVSEYYPR